MRCMCSSYGVFPSSIVSPRCTSVQHVSPQGKTPRAPRSTSSSSSCARDWIVPICSRFFGSSDGQTAPGGKFYLRPAQSPHSDARTSSILLELQPVGPVDPTCAAGFGSGEVFKVRRLTKPTRGAVEVRCFLPKSCANPIYSSIFTHLVSPRQYLWAISLAVSLGHISDVSHTRVSHV